MSTSKGMIHHDESCKSSEQLFKNAVRGSLSKHCSGELIGNYSRLLVKKDNNLRKVQGSLLFNTV